MAPDLLGGRLLMRGAGQAWQEPQQVGYLLEADMQQMLAEQPSLLPGVSGQALVAREFRTEVGPSDVLVVDADGAVTIVECKLASNVEIRRKIVGQVLDYAARLWRMPLADFDARWAACSQGVGVLAALDAEATAALTAALAEGAFRLVLAVDSINEDLRNIVEYLNAHTTGKVSVLAVELQRASHAGVEILLPRTFGEELVRAKEEKSGRAKRPAWTIDDCRSRLGEIDPLLRDCFDRLNTDMVSAGCTANGTAANEPSMIFRLQTADGAVSWPYAVYTGERPVVQVNFQWLAKEPSAARQTFLDVLGGEPTALDGDAIRASNFQKRPSVPLERLLDSAVHAQFVAAVAALGRSA